MRNDALILLGTLLLVVRAHAADHLLANVLVYDGTGRPAYATDVRTHGNRIAAVAKHLKPRANEAVHDEHGLALAPGFIDMHSHGNRGLFFAHLEATRAAINVASMVGHAPELAKMKTLLAKELRAGAFGLSTGLEYEEGHFATTEEVIAASRRSWSLATG